MRRAEWDSVDLELDPLVYEGGLLLVPVFLWRLTGTDALPRRGVASSTERWKHGLTLGAAGDKSLSL